MIRHGFSSAAVATLFTSWAALGQPGAALPGLEVASVKLANPELGIIDMHLPNLRADRPVVNMTAGLYDFRLEWISRAESLDGSGGPTMFTAIERLGRKLEGRKQAIDITVIDRAENKPTEN